MPVDGGTPRSPDCIRQRGGEISVRVRREEGRNSLDHAPSRLNLVLRNRANEPIQVRLALDLSDRGDGQEPSRAPLWGAPQERDYVFLRPPRGVWQRVDGEIQHWTVRVTLHLEPGDSLLALSPEYTYGDYLRFVHSLSEGPLLRKVLLGRSDGGREHWGLRITDPEGPQEKKLRFLLAARAHAYETFGSFAVEGMIRYLLGNPPEANLKLFDFEVLPMLNVDGVAQGYEYTEGFEHGPGRDLTACASGRLYFQRIDEWQPHILVSLHNWITPRALDLMSYTDADSAGRPIDRAQEMLRAFFPPQTQYGKRWLNDMEPPLAQNWMLEDEKESPKLTNPEVYAHIRYRTEIWVPEFPWFGRDDGDPVQIAFETGRLYLRALLQTLVRTHSLSSAVLEAPLEQRWLSEWEPAGSPEPQHVGRDALLNGGPLVLDRVAFARGLAMASGGAVSYDLAGQWDEFAAVAGLAGDLPAGAAVEFRVEGDGRLLWASRPHHVPYHRDRFVVDVRGVRMLTLVARMLDERRSGGTAQALWADAKVTREARDRH